MDIDSLTCSFAYGEGLTFSRTLQVLGMVTASGGIEGCDEDEGG
jgi:hypothetical protein